MERTFANFFYNIEHIAERLVCFEEENKIFSQITEYDKFRAVLIEETLRLYEATIEYVRIGEELGHFRGTKRIGLLTFLYDKHQDFLGGTADEIIHQHLMMNFVAKCALNIDKNLSFHFNQFPKEKEKFRADLNKIQEYELDADEILVKQFLSKEEILEEKVKIYLVNFEHDKTPADFQSNFSFNDLDNPHTERVNLCENSDVLSVRGVPIPVQTVKNLLTLTKAKIWF